MQSVIFKTTGIGNYNPNTIKSYKILQKLSPKHAAHCVAQSTYLIYRHGKVWLSKQPPWRPAGDSRLARGRSRVWAPGPATVHAHAFFLHPPLLPPLGDSFFHNFPTNPTKVLGLGPFLKITLPEKPLTVLYTNGHISQSKRSINRGGL